MHSFRRTILFVDVVKSTDLYGYIGDEAAQERVGGCMKDLQEVIERHGGRVVKSSGDGLLTDFETEPSAVAGAFELVTRAPHHHLRVHVGVHCGKVLEENGDVFGQVVNIASRITALAKPSEILVSSEVFSCLPPVMQEGAKRVTGLSIKGVQEPLELVALSQGDSSETQTITASSLRANRPAFGALELEYRDRTYSVGPLAEFSMGRGPENDLVVESPRISRRHVSISNRRGKFILTDQSVNGTWLVHDDGANMHLLREEGLIHGSGKLFLGNDPKHEDARPILFRART